MSNLAIKGGTPIREKSKNPWPKWPVWDKAEERALLEVLHSGVWSYNGPKEVEFNKKFAAYTGSKYALCAANGTVTLQLALEACGIGLGDEVIVPGLTWQATAAAVLDVNATPILTDVDARTWCIDPNEIRKNITAATKAIIPVHLYGCMADMDAIKAIAEEHELFIIEDCAHKHGGEWNGVKAGAIGDIGSFSFQLSKTMTAGEGGALTTSSDELAEKLDALRNCGRRPEAEEAEADKGAGVYGDDGNFIQSGNFRITDFQAALLVEGLRRLPEQNDLREKNAAYLNGLLADVAGIEPMYHDPRETKKAFFNYAFRYNSDAFDGLPADKFRQALEAELDCTIESSYEPLNNCSLYRPHTKPARHNLSRHYWQKIDPEKTSLPVCEKVFADQAVCFHHLVLMDDEKAMDQIVDAIEKIRQHAHELVDVSEVV
ncbi:MAG: DegT/DnrJ/EryC1/StrS family aminotransferase [Calditrichaeota bacterium]|nr:MAG: DegT/DnrJ/EryC1/StrS family aminotransferase [Calditrichota bacterium]